MHKGVSFAQGHTTGTQNMWNLHIGFLVYEYHIAHPEMALRNVIMVEKNDLVSLQIAHWLCLGPADYLQGK